MHNFYRQLEVESTEWWIEESLLPERFCWARLRTFTNGTADVRFDVSGEDKCWGFTDRQSAIHYLLEDEFRNIATLDAEDFNYLGLTMKELIIPSCFPDKSVEFEYVGKY